MRTMKLGTSNLQVPVIAVGCMRITRLTKPEAERFVQASIDAGATFFDHADKYGDGACEERFADAIHMFSGLSASIAGILLTAYLGTAKADMGSEYTLPIITAVVLGGTSNLGGSGGVIGSALAALAVGFLRIGLGLNGLSTQYLDIPVGILLVVTVSLRFAGTNPKLRKLFSRKKRQTVVSKGN